MLCRAYSFFAELPANYSIADGVSALARKGLLTEGRVQEITRRLEAVDAAGGTRQAARQIKELHEGEISLSEAVPRLKAFWTRTLSVAKFQESAGENLQTYRPKIERYDNVAVLQIDVNVYGGTQHYAVALTGKELAVFIRRLQTTEIELSALAKATETAHGK